MVRRWLNHLWLAVPFLLSSSAMAVEGAEQSGPPELPSLAKLLVHWLGPDYEWIETWVNPLYALVTAIILCVIALTVYRRRELIPGRLQNLVEMLVEGMYNFLHGILGSETKRYFPLLATLFFYILVNNLMGIVPLGHSPSTAKEVTISLGLIVFVFAQYTGIRRLGVVRYFDHLAGSPRSVLEWVLAILIIFPVHVILECAKPLSLGLRLFGNITGEDILIAAFVGLGIMFMGLFGHTVAENTWVGVPFQVPFIFLGMLLSTIQALVFTLLATIYILMMLPHEEHH